jgi:transketolase
VALAAREQLHADGISTRVVSMPCRELFDRQSQQYRDDVLPPSVTARVAVERAPTLGWDRYVGTDDAVAGIHTFGALTHRKLLVELGFTSDQVAQAARDRLAAVRRR